MTVPVAPAPFSTCRRQDLTRLHTTRLPRSHHDAQETRHYATGLRMAVPHRTFRKRDLKRQDVTLPNPQETRLAPAPVALWSAGVTPPTGDSTPQNWPLQYSTGRAGNDTSGDGPPSTEGREVASPVLG